MLREVGVLWWPNIVEISLAVPYISGPRRFVDGRSAVSHLIRNRVQPASDGDAVRFDNPQGAMRRSENQHRTSPRFSTSIPA